MSKLLARCLWEQIEPTHRFLDIMRNAEVIDMFLDECERDLQNMRPDLYATEKTEGTR